MKLEDLKKIFNQTYNEYNDYMDKNISDYWNHHHFITRRLQIESVINALNEDFNFDKLIILETGVSCNIEGGLFGLFLGFIAEKTNGEMIGIDTNIELIEKSRDLFNKSIPSLNYTLLNGDSVQWLNQLSEIPNLVHLDSWDLDLKNPLPSALHGWREFITIESKMQSGSIIIIDDNYLQGSWVEWKYFDGSSERIDITYPIIGKGSLIYHYVLNNISNWKLIGNHYNAGFNIKVIIQKQ